jgi:hypothetical protein
VIYWLLALENAKYWMSTTHDSYYQSSYKAACVLLNECSSRSRSTEHGIQTAHCSYSVVSEHDNIASVIGIERGKSKQIKIRTVSRIKKKNLKIAIDKTQSLNEEF